MTRTRYRCRSLIGEGGMANVWHADRLLADGSRQDVAIKVVHDPLRREPEVMQRFRQEAALTMGLHHQNVIKTYDLHHHEGQEVMVMEHVDGPSLHALVKMTEVPIPVLRHIFMSAADGLGHLHEHGVIHRDVSPGNILLSRAGDVRVADLGLAKVLGTPKSDGHFKGTPAYASLEVLRCSDVDESSDLYSLAAVFYEILTGEPPYGIGQHPQLLHRHRMQTIEPLPPDGPADFRAILAALLQPPGSREIGSVPELWAQWDQFEDPLASRHQVAGFIRQVMDDSSSKKDREQAADEPAAEAGNRTKAIEDPEQHISHSRPVSETHAATATRRWLIAAMLLSSIALLLALHGLLSGPDERTTPPADEDLRAADEDLRAESKPDLEADLEEDLDADLLRPPDQDRTTREHLHLPTIENNDEAKTTATRPAESPIAVSGETPDTAGTAATGSFPGIAAALRTGRRAPRSRSHVRGHSQKQYQPKTATILWPTEQHNRPIR